MVAEEGGCVEKLSPLYLTEIIISTRIRAANSNTISIAKSELKVAIAYLEAKDLAHGFVSIFLKQPKNDIGFFYTNVKASLSELESLPDSSSQLEKSNMLMKLRETLTDNGENGTILACPDGISIHPHNALFFWVLFFAFPICVISGVVISSEW